MSAFGPHAAFILGAYAAVVAVISALVLWIFADHRARLRELAALDQRRRDEPDGQNRLRDV
jgi:heme exporter protein D